MRRSWLAAAVWSASSLNIVCSKTGFVSERKDGKERRLVRLRAANEILERGRGFVGDWAASRMKDKVEKCFLGLQIANITSSEEFLADARCQLYLDLYPSSSDGNYKRSEAVFCELEE